MNRNSKAIALAAMVASCSTFSHSSYAVDPFTAVALIGGAAFLASNHHHAHVYPSYRRVVTRPLVRSAYPTTVVDAGYPVASVVASPTYVSSYSYAPAVQYVVRTVPRVRGHVCGYDGICIGH